MNCIVIELETNSIYIFMQFKHRNKLAGCLLKEHRPMIEERRTCSHQVILASEMKRFKNK